MKKVITTLLMAIAFLACHNQNSSRLDAVSEFQGRIFESTSIPSFNLKDDMEEVTKAIAESNAIYFTSFVENDSMIFIGRYAEDACILPPGSPPLCGRREAARFFRNAYDDAGLRGGKFITTAIYGDGDEFVTEEGLWQSVDSKGKLFDDGKFLVLWKKTGEGWKMYRDSFSSNRK
jgi:ketosteroid isomerase-like protein